MSNDTNTNTVTIVYFVKHWDNNTKGYIEFPNVYGLANAIRQTERILVDEALEDNASNSVISPATLFTITKAELDQGSNWNGGPR